MQAQRGRGLAGHHVSRRMLVVDEADLTGAFARFDVAHRVVVQGPEVNLQPAAHYQVEVLVAIEGR
ncbi:hypothetical protein D3C85_1598430 [compost metagenome]